MVHMDPGADALEVLRFFQANGTAPDRLMICHLDRTRYDFGYHEAIAETGAFLEYDTIHRPKYHSNEDEIALIAHMVSCGFGSQLLFGLDTTRERLKSYGAAFGLDYILTEFQWQLEPHIGAGMIKKIMTVNPGRLLQMIL